MGLFCLDNSRREQQFLGDWPANLVRQCPGAVDPTVGRRQKAEAGILAADAHIERRRQYRRSAIGKAVDHADRRLGAGGDLVAAAAAASFQFLRRVSPVILALLVDIAARRKRLLTGAGDDDAADCVVMVEFLDCLAQFARQFAVHRVELVGPVQRNDTDTVLTIDQDMLVSHFSSECCHFEKSVEEQLIDKLALLSCHRRRVYAVPGRRREYTSADGKAFSAIPISVLRRPDRKV